MKSPERFQASAVDELAQCRIEHERPVGARVLGPGFPERKSQRDRERVTHVEHHEAPVVAHSAHSSLILMAFAVFGSTAHERTQSPHCPARIAPAPTLMPIIRVVVMSVAAGVRAAPHVDVVEDGA